MEINKNVFDDILKLACICSDNPGTKALAEELRRIPAASQNCVVLLSDNEIMPPFSNEPLFRNCGKAMYGVEGPEPDDNSEQQYYDEVVSKQ